MDRRQKKTRAAIFSAFTELLQKKSYSKITIKDIIDTANIGRSTFYTHFETKDELLMEMCTDIFDHVFSDELTKEDTHDYSSKDKSFIDKIEHILVHIEIKSI
ncbi:Transcriptional regulator, TetR family [Clostridiaceae bacterium JG1575]|nr:Transcriptional regulator, TetR family [Clostridiaceae bacterium JG1575]